MQDLPIAKAANFGYNGYNVIDKGQCWTYANKFGRRRPKSLRFWTKCSI